MFGQFGWGEMLLLVIVGLFVFGPERLPTVARDAAKIIRQFRDTARGMRDELKAELGPEMADLDLDSLNPRKLVEKHLLSEDELKDMFADDDDESSASGRRPGQRDGSQKNGADANGSSRRRPPATTLHSKSKIPLAKTTGSDLPPSEDASGATDTTVQLSKPGDTSEPTAGARSEPVSATGGEGGAVLERAQSAPIRKVTPPSDAAPADRPAAPTGAASNARYDDEDVM